MTISAIIGGVRDRLQIEDHVALVGTGLVIGLEVLSLTTSSPAAADISAFGAALLITTVVMWFTAKIVRRDRS